MRFVRLVVEHFQAIERCDVELAPGLNVLYGPNDLGKSTLARALRAALLLPSSSAEGRGYAPWLGDHVPRVSLTFLDSTGRYHRVTKEYGDGTRAQATLEVSKDGKEWDQDAAGREVDDRLRKLLAWGIPTPGGKSGTRGLPRAFISEALLGDQSEVQQILEQSIEKDADDGKLRLTRALQGLAQDPQVKAVLARVQAEVARVFTDKGARKRDKTSPFRGVTERIGLLRTELENRAQELRASEGAERAVEEARERLGRLEDGRQDAAALVQKTGERVAKTQARRRCQETVDLARRAVDAIDVLDRKIAERSDAFAAQEREVGQREEALARVRLRVREAQGALEKAREAAQRLAGGAMEAERKLRRAELEGRLATWSQRRAEAEDRRGKARAALELARSLAAQEEQAAGHQRKAAKERERIEQLRRELEEVHQDRQSFAEVQAYARAGRARKSVEDAQAAVAKVAQIERASAELKAEVEGLEAGLGALEAPSAEVVQRIQRLEQELKVAEAALGGGLSVTVRPSKRLTITAGLDGREARSIEGDVAQSLEAERSIELAVKGVMELRVVAGDAARRTRAQELREAWARDGTPVLAAAGVADVAALQERRRRADEAARAIQAKRTELERLEAQRSGLLPRLDDLPRLQEELAGLTQQLQGRDLEPVRAALQRMPAGWEGRIAQTTAEIDARHARATSSLATAEAAVGQLGIQLAGAEATANSLRGQLEAQVNALGMSPEQALETAQGDAQAIDAEAQVVKEAIAGLDRELASGMEKARQSLDAAQALLDEASEAAEAQERQVQDARSGRDSMSGELKSLKEQAAQASRADAVARLERAQAQLQELPLPDEEATEQDLETARAALQRVDEEVQQASRDQAQAQGAIQGVGGAVARDRFDEVKQALDREQERQRQLELDADAWKLLRDTLNDMESTTGQHLGRALGSAVGQRFSELTGGRYAGVEVGADLQVGAVLVAGAARATDLLSEGTRDQLATVLRLAIAQSLGSAVVLDDHLVQTDRTRFAWFREALQHAAQSIQVIVLTCRPDDYLMDAKAGPLSSRVIDLEPVMRRGSVRTSGS